MLAVFSEQQYVKLVLSRREDDPLQDKVLVFYNEKNTDQGLYDQMWFPYISQVCLVRTEIRNKAFTIVLLHFCILLEDPWVVCPFQNDAGGSKQILQFTWTSQMSTRLFCGDSASRQHFSELVDVAMLHAQRWNETRVYALFRNQW